MSKPVIEIKGLSKAYMIGHEQQAMAGTLTIRDSITSLAKKPLELFTGHQMKKEKFWALKNINLDISQGDVVGIIGRNGSGKSTLLKLLSRIVEPTKGEAILRGRVASLLEVGTGFHPELTGRENIYFNGAILGMSRKEIRSKFDEIVAFSEVEKFLDTPVKFYSSGMYVRLAFAVAAHLDPDILIVDEVLAVGDAAFQKKSLRKMKSVAESGRTVVYVSHSMGSVKQLCTKAALLRNGELVEFGPVDKVINQYMNASVGLIDGRKMQTIKIDDEQVVFENFRLNDIACEADPEILSGEALNITAEYTAESGGQDLCVGFSLKSQSDGVYIAYTHSHLEEVKYTLGKHGKLKAKLKLPKLSPGGYTLELQIWINGKHYIQEQELCDVRIMPAAAFRSQSVMDNFPSLLLIDSDWKFTTDEDPT